MSDIPFDTLQPVFEHSGSAVGMDQFIHTLREGTDHHALFRALLLQKRIELGLPLINPGDMREVPDDKRTAYEDFVEATCREVGLRCLDSGNISQAWRYFKTIGDKEPIRKALEKTDPRNVSDDTIQVAIDHGVHPRRGFEFVLSRDGICEAISTFEKEFSIIIADKCFAAGTLVRAMYKELMIGVRRHLYERYGEHPDAPETDLVESIRSRAWLFDGSRTHADPSHVFTISRIGLICESPEEQIMALSIAEYGRMLNPAHQYDGRPPFEKGYDDYALYQRALLGQNVESTLEHFRSRIVTYDLSLMDNEAVELVLRLMWKCGKKDEALAYWQEYLGQTPPEMPGRFIPSYYDLCLDAKSYSRLAEMAQLHGDVAAWAAALVMQTEQRQAETVAVAAVTSDPTATPSQPSQDPGQPTESLPSDKVQG